jgi:hypothetical protein
MHYRTAEMATVPNVPINSSHQRHAMHFLISNLQTCSMERFLNSSVRQTNTPDPTTIDEILKTANQQKTA